MRTGGDRPGVTSAGTALLGVTHCLAALEDRSPHEPPGRRSQHWQAVRGSYKPWLKKTIGL